MSKYYLYQMNKILYLFFVLLFSCSYSDNTILVVNSGEAQGSYYNIKYMSVNGKDYSSQIDSILLEIDSSLSIYKEYSLISTINMGKDVKIDNFFKDVYKSSKQVYYESSGYFDCTVSPLLKYYGFYYDNQDTLIIDSTHVKNVLEFVGFDKTTLIDDSLVLWKGTQLDFNSKIYLQSSIEYLQFVDIVQGLVKASVFGFIVTLIGCYQGFKCGEGAQGVGKAATSAVVTSSILILILRSS